jgi:hypothetical protein
MPKKPRSPSPAKTTPAAAGLPAEGIVLGPILGLESRAEGTVATCCVVYAGPRPKRLVWKVGGEERVFAATHTLHHGVHYRAERPLRAGEAALVYQVFGDGRALAGTDGGTRWSFTPPPAEAVGFRFAYASCNGFSAAKLLAQNQDPYGMWRRLRAEHERSPYHLLAMGGDQIYADAIWEQPWMEAYNELDHAEAVRAKLPPGQEERLERFYELLYLRQWRRPEVAEVMARVPSIMMWDDHDIFDGWGSFPRAQQESDTFRAIYRAASRAFEIFQLRAVGRENLLGHAGGTYDFELSVAGTTFLVLDNRSRRTREALVPAEQWKVWKDWIGAFSGRRLFVMTGVPVIYRTFGAIESWMSFTPWQEELEDDLLDHWSAAVNQKDRVRLIYNLVNRQEALKLAGGAQWAFLSGDVHVGGVGVAWDERINCGVYQLISSGIAHPPPSAVQWKAIQLTSGDTPEPIGDGDLVARLLVPTGASANYLRTRNFLSSEIGSDHQLWFEWICEDGRRPVFTIKP